jgi:hypothetical protein
MPNRTFFSNRFVRLVESKSKTPVQDWGISFMEDSQAYKTVNEEIVIIMPSEGTKYAIDYNDRG